MNTTLKTVLTTVAAGVILALIAGATNLTFVAYGADRKADQNAKDIAETKANTKEAAAKAAQAAEIAGRVDERTKAILDALSDIQRRLP